MSKVKPTVRAQAEKARVKKSRKPLRSVESSLVPQDRARYALATGRLAFRLMRVDWRAVRPDAHMYDYDFPDKPQPHADSIAQEVARNLERYLYSAPRQLSIPLAGEVIRGLLYESMIGEIGLGAGSIYFGRSAKDKPSRKSRSRRVLPKWGWLDTDWAPKEVNAMVKHGILARGSSGPRHAKNQIRRPAQT